MKKTLILLISCLMAITSSAQKFETRFLVDYSTAIICGMDEESFMEYEKDWTTDKPEISSRIISEIQKKTDGLMVIKKDAPNIIKITIESITDNGGMYCNLVCSDSDGNILFKIENVSCKKGGTFGTKLNLMKDGAEKLGSKIGSLLKKELKRL